MSDDDKPVDLRVVKVPVAASELKQSIVEYRRIMPDLIEYHRLEATVWFARFTALKESGFSASEALQLCSR